MRSLVPLEDHALHSYVGGWPEYVRVREERAREAAGKPKPAPRLKTAARSPSKATSNREQEKLEREIEDAEGALRALEEELADPVAWSTPKQSASSSARHEAAKRAVQELYARWERIAG